MKPQNVKRQNMAHENDDDTVGYGKPPRKHRFRKGRSGNPRGRPKGSKNLTTVLAKTIAEKVEITENGQRRAVSKLEVAVKQLVNRAAAGDARASHQLFSLAQWVEGRAEAPSAAADPVTDADREVIAAVFARLQAAPEGGRNG
jgi:Family of unknown function (DUF5681)